MAEPVANEKNWPYLIEFFAVHNYWLFLIDSDKYNSSNKFISYGTVLERIFYLLVTSVMYTSKACPILSQDTLVINQEITMSIRGRAPEILVIVVIKRVDFGGLQVAIVQKNIQSSVSSRY